jgi:hypothetical protein
MLNSKKRRSDYGLWYITIPLINRKNWQRYYAKRKELLGRAAATYKHFQDPSYADKIKDCPKCGLDTYMQVTPYYYVGNKVKGKTYYRCYTCNDTPKEWE